MDHRACKEDPGPTPRWLCRICCVLATPALVASMYLDLQGVPSRYQWVQVVPVSMVDPRPNMVPAWEWGRVDSQEWEA